MGKYVIRQTETGVKFDLRAANGEVIATSEVYTNPDSCRKGIASVRKNAPGANVKTRQWLISLPKSAPSLRSTPTRPGSTASV